MAKSFVLLLVVAATLFQIVNGSSVKINIQINIHKPAPGKVIRWKQTISDHEHSAEKLKDWTGNKIINWAAVSVKKVIEKKWDKGELNEDNEAYQMKDLDIKHEGHLETMDDNKWTGNPTTILTTDKLGTKDQVFVKFGVTYNVFLKKKTKTVSETGEIQRQKTDFHAHIREQDNFYDYNGYEEQNDIGETDSMGLMTFGLMMMFFMVICIICTCLSFIGGGISGFLSQKTFQTKPNVDSFEVQHVRK
eukprot:406316_1